MPTQDARQPTVRRCCWCRSPFIRWREGEDVFYVCPTEKCRRRQARYGLATNGRVVYMPLPRQVMALMAVRRRRYRWILYGGARGGAKSHFLRWLAYAPCLRYPRFRVLLLRRTYPDLEKTHMSRIPEDIERLGGPQAAEFTPSGRPPTVKFYNRAVIELGHCQDAQDVAHYLSAEYNLILFDEIGTFEEDMVIKIGSSARLHHPQFKPCVIGGTNPGTIWVRDRWIHKEVDLTRYKRYNPAQYHFIQSLLDDNPYPDEEYEAMLEELDPDTYEAWRMGSWDVFEGQYFKEFRRDKHCEVLEIPADIPRIGGFDWGYSPDPAVMLFAVVLPDGHLHIEKEMVFRETIAAEVGAHIMRECKDCGINLATAWADPATKIRSGQTGESIYETLGRSGLPVVAANHERLNGWQRLRHWLRPNPVTNKPWLTINPETCRGLVRTLPALKHDETKPEDVDTDGPDHWADALRYLVMGRPAPMQVGKADIEPPPESAGALMREVMQANVTVMGADRVAAR